MRTFLYMLAVSGLMLAPAYAGFEWVAPPKTSMPAAKENKKDLAPQEMIGRIQDYEAGRISVRQMEEERRLHLEAAAKELARQTKLLEEREAMLRARETKKQVMLQDALQPPAPQPVTPNPSVALFTDAALPNVVAASIPSDETALEALPLDPTQPPLVGFGSQVPLAMAAIDILPSGYSIAFGKGVNPGMLLEWDGLHRPWQIVLAESLGRHRLVGSVKNKIVTIRKMAGTPDPIMPAGYVPAGSIILNPMPVPKSIRTFAAVDPSVGALSVAPMMAAPPTSILSHDAYQAPDTAPISLSAFPLSAPQKKAASQKAPAKKSKVSPFTPVNKPMTPHAAKTAPVSQPSPQSAPDEQAEGTHISRSESKKIAAERDGALKGVQDRLYSWGEKMKSLF